MRAIHLFPAVITVAVSSACDRQQERESVPPPVTEITSGPMERIVVPTGWDEHGDKEADGKKETRKANMKNDARGQGAPKTERALGPRPAQARDEEEKTSSGYPEVRDTIDEVDPRSDPEGLRDPWDAPPIVGTTTVTAGEVDPASEDAAQPEQPEQPQEQKNRSTVLGDGSSGMYTGGEGTYGGRATWGTGAGASK